MFSWFNRKKRHKKEVEETQFPEDHIIRAKIAGLVGATIANNSIIRDTAKPNCAVVLDVYGDVSLRWISESDNVSDVVGFALLSQLSTYRELLEICVQEIKAGTFGDAFLGGPGLILFDRVAIEALNAMKHDSKGIEG